MNTFRNSDKIAMIILAAGASNRMGRNKQLLPWKNHNLIKHVISNGSKASLKSIFVVLGANAEEIANSLSTENIEIIINPFWKEGMGTSIASVMHNFTKNKITYDAVLIALVDQPLLEDKHYKKLIYKYINTYKNIVATQMRGGVGVPAILNSKYFKELGKLKENYGARAIIAANSGDVLSLKPIGQIVDIDTIGTYNLLYKKYGK